MTRGVTLMQGQLVAAAMAVATIEPTAKLVLIAMALRADDAGRCVVRITGPDSLEEDTWLHEIVIKAVLEDLHALRHVEVSIVPFTLEHSVLLHPQVSA